MNAKAPKIEKAGHVGQRPRTKSPSGDPFAPPPARRPTVEELCRRMFDGLLEFRTAHDLLCHRKAWPSDEVQRLRDAATDVLDSEGVEYEVEVKP